MAGEESSERNPKDEEEVQNQNSRGCHGMEIQTFLRSRRYVDCRNATKCQDPSDVCCRKT